ncbi:MBL fold metallo-hydrolase [bacterium]|nr:MAG: MBL fold metallo-hydrolase [bacterium]
MKAYRLSLAVIILLFCFGSGISLCAGPAGSEQDSTVAKPASWFAVKQVAEGVWRIDDHGGDNMYLVAGKEKALLIDAGTGVADLLACVKKITSLPLLLVNTHGHPDHCGSDYQFSQVYAHRADSGMIAGFCSEDFHKRMVQGAETQSPELSSSFVRDAIVKMPRLLPIQEGFLFDLGERKLEVIEVPGHTKGSVCLLDARNQLLFTGDNDNTLVWLFLEDCLPLDVYVKSLQNLKKRSGEFSTLLPGHGDPLDKKFIDDQIMCGRQILSGECKGEPYKTFVDYARVCKYRAASIAFNPDNLHAKGK